MIEQPIVSVVIPVKNEAVWMAACLEGILSQTVAVEEILVIDSGSTDGTQDIVRRYPKARLLEIAPSEFNHGDTRNLGVRETSGTFILFTVGDARPVDDTWIERLLAGFTDDDVAAVSGIQVVAHDRRNNPLEWFRPVSEPVRTIHRFGSAEAFDTADSAARQAACVIDDVTSMYRRSFLEQVPFRRTVYGEDMLICVDALRAGHALVREPGARVFHYHLQNYRTTLQRTIAVCLMRRDLFGTMPGTQTSRPFRDAMRLLREPSLTFGDKLYWWRNQRTCLRAEADGFAIFRKAETEGAEALAALHQEYLGAPPIPVKRDAASAA